MDDRRWDVVVADDLPAAELEAAASFFETSFPGTFEPRCTPAMFRWKLGPANPAGSGRMTLAMHEGRVVGTMTATKKRLVVDGETIVGVEVGDTFTHPDFRRGGGAAVPFPGTDPDSYLNKSIFGRLVRETTDRLRGEGIALVYGTPNANSRPGYVERAGYLLAEDASGTSWRRPTARRLNRVRGAGPLVPVARLLDALASAAVGGADLESGWPDPEELDELWRRASPRAGLAIVQDGAWFTHRYRQHPDLAFDAHRVRVGGRLAAVVVGRTSEDREGRRSYLVAETLADAAGRTALPGALVALVRRVRRDVESVSLWSSTGVGRRALFVRADPVPVIFDDTALARELVDRRVGWDLQRGWSDNA